MSPQKQKIRSVRMKKIISALKKKYPHARIVLNYKNNWELLVSVVLSAQCTDVRVNAVTKKLFKKYTTLDDYINASQKEFEQDIRQTGFFRNKAKNILAAAKLVKETFKEKLPRTMEEMLTIPGVARKTANVVLGNAFGIVEGIAVDTHVRRFALKLDLTDSKDPKKIEQDLMAITPKEDWFALTYLLIEYGRQECPARKHDCENHALSKIYPKAGHTFPKAK